jgi:hypothetical protein
LCRYQVRAHSDAAVWHPRRAPHPTSGAWFTRHHTNTSSHIPVDVSSIFRTWVLNHTRTSPMRLTCVNHLDPAILQIIYVWCTFAKSGIRCDLTNLIPLKIPVRVLFTFVSAGLGGLLNDRASLCRNGFSGSHQSVRSLIRAGEEGIWMLGMSRLSNFAGLIFDTSSLCKK